MKVKAEVFLGGITGKRRPEMQTEWYGGGTRAGQGSRQITYRHLQILWRLVSCQLHLIGKLLVSIVQDYSLQRRRMSRQRWKRQRKQ